MRVHTLQENKPVIYRMNFGFQFKAELIAYRSDYVYKCKNDGNTDGDFNIITRLASRYTDHQHNSNL